ncbi:MAG: Glycosyl transferase group 1 [Microgenomates bacterium OLB23]|nr:MAG: Glycosyl transferase group 1 [Microgenomates bacterium OLB23]
MKILMLTPYLPYPPSSGGQVRSYNLIKHLSRNHEIYLVALMKSKDEETYKKNLMPYCKEIHVCKRSESPWTIRNIATSVFGQYPFLVVRNYSEEARKTVADLLHKHKFDLIHAETFYIMPHIPPTNLPILLVEQTIEYRVYQHFVNNLKFIPVRPFFYFDILKLRFWEKTFWRRASLVGAVSEDDEEKMHELSPGLPTTIIANAAGEDLLKVYNPKKSKAQDPVFLYQGNFSWLQNIEAAEYLITHIFPAIKKLLPNASCIIAGQRALEKLGEVKVNGVEIVDIGSANPDEVIKVYAKASMFLAPIYGPGGTRLKILGAMAAGLPVISSPTGVSGLGVTQNENVIIAQTVDEFARAAELFIQK